MDSSIAARKEWATELRCPRRAPEVSVVNNFNHKGE